MSILVNLVAEGETTHAALDAEHVVVHGEHVHVCAARTGLALDLHLRVVDAREVAGTGGLVLLGLKGKGVRVDTQVRVAAVVVEGLHLVEVLPGLLLEPVLTVEDQLEGIKRTNLSAGTLLAEPLSAVGDHHRCTDTAERRAVSIGIGGVPRVQKITNCRQIGTPLI